MLEHRLTARWQAELYSLDQLQIHWIVFDALDDDGGCCTAPGLRRVALVWIHLFLLGIMSLLTALCAVYQLTDKKIAKETCAKPFSEYVRLGVCMHTKCLTTVRRKLQNFVGSNEILILFA